MRLRFLVAALIGLAACGPAEEQPQPQPAEPSAPTIPVYDPPLSRPAGGVVGGDAVVQEGGCWVSPSWSVREVESASGRLLLVGPADRCPTAAAEASWSRTLAENESFLGIHRDVIIVDRGTGPDGRELEVVRVSSGEVLYDGPYQHDEIAVAGRILIFYLPIDPPADAVCAEDYAAQGLGTGYERVVGLLMDTGELSPMRGVTCSPRQ